MKVIIATTVLLPLILCVGCSTIVSHGGGESPISKNGVYRGVRLDCHNIRNPGPELPAGFSICYSLVDFPFSTIGDTLLFPFDLFIPNNNTQ
jgi:uncharacterized protein YceK